MAKILKIYEELPEEEKKEWLTLTQATKAFRVFLLTPEQVYNMHKYGNVRTREMAIYSEDYNYHVLHGMFDFIGKKYDMEKFYNKSDLKKFVRTFQEPPPFPFGWEKDRVNYGKLNDLRSYINDIRNMEKSSHVMHVSFYGDQKESIVHHDETQQYRMYYAVFLNRSFIEKTVADMYEIKTVLLDLLVFLYTYKFFTHRNMYHYHSINTAAMFSDKDGEPTVRKSAKSAKEMLLERGYIMKEPYSKNSLHKKRYSEALYTTTDKTNKIVKDYIDYVMYKKKLPYIGQSKSGRGITYLDIKERRRDVKYPKTKISPKAYTFYEYCYDYVNYKAEVEMFSGTMEEFMKKSSSVELKFNPMIYRLAQEIYLREGSDVKSKTFIDNFLSSDRWGSKS